MKPFAVVQESALMTFGAWMWIHRHGVVYFGKRTDEHRLR